MKHAKLAGRFLREEKNVRSHDTAVWFIRKKRDIAVAGVPDWEALRMQASRIKEHVLAHLGQYLLEFEKQAVANGAVVHWASDAIEHNNIILGILRRHHVRKLVKSKSMLTEECGLNDFLELEGIEVIDTDLGERIVQLADEGPSHIVMPAIHKKKESIGALFEQELHTEPGNCDPEYLTREARMHLRSHFMEAGAALTGVNFAVSENGALVVCTNEGNADMGVQLAPIHIASMGIEKIIPRQADLGVFLRLLARSATGQPITAITTHIRRPLSGRELHIVLVDNGRSAILKKEKFRNALKCIRCGACLNTCPVYRRSGGYSYRYAIPGPIGSILAPHRDAEGYGDLPFASSLCGSCSDICPVKIDIHEQLYAWRQDIALSSSKPDTVKRTLRIGLSIAERPWLFRLAGKAARWALRYLPKAWIYHPANIWGKSHAMPEAPKSSFSEWYRNYGNL